METEWHSTYLPSFSLAVCKLYEREGLHCDFIPSRAALKLSGQERNAKDHAWKQSI